MAFFTYNITQKSYNSQNSSPRFLVDAMFGKLGVFLRILGFDTFVAPINWPDSRVFAYAKDEKRILITRDKEFTRIIKNEKYPVIFSADDNIENLLKNIAQVYEKEFKMRITDICRNKKMISRCSKCNALIKYVEKSKIVDKLLIGTAQHYEHFWICTNKECKKIYWMGKHFEKLCRLFERLL